MIAEVWKFVHRLVGVIAFYYGKEKEMELGFHRVGSVDGWTQDTCLPGVSLVPRLGRRRPGRHAELGQPPCSSFGEGLAQPVPFLVKSMPHGPIPWDTDVPLTWVSRTIGIVISGAEPTRPEVVPAPVAPT